MDLKMWRKRRKLEMGMNFKQENNVGWVGFIGTWSGGKGFISFWVSMKLIITIAWKVEEERPNRTEEKLVSVCCSVDTTRRVRVPHSPCYFEVKVSRNGNFYIKHPEFWLIYKISFLFFFLTFVDGKELVSDYSIIK